MGKKRKARSPRTEPRTRTTAAGTCTPDRLSAEGLRGKSVVDNVWAATAFGRKKKDRTPAESRHIAHLTAKCGRLLKIFAVSLQELRTQSSWDADEDGRRGQLVSAPSKFSRAFMETRGLGSGTLPSTKPGRSYKTFCVGVGPSRKASIIKIKSIGNKGSDQYNCATQNAQDLRQIAQLPPTFYPETDRHVLFVLGLFPKFLLRSEMSFLKCPTGHLNSLNKFNRRKDHTQSLASPKYQPNRDGSCVVSELTSVLSRLAQPTSERCTPPPINTFGINELDEGEHCFV